MKISICYLLIIFFGLFVQANDYCKKGYLIEMGSSYIGSTYYVCPDKPKCYDPELCAGSITIKGSFCSDGEIVSMGFYPINDKFACPKEVGCFRADRCPTELSANFCKGNELVSMGFFNIDNRYVCPRHMGCYVPEKCTN